MYQLCNTSGCCPGGGGTCNGKVFHIIGCNSLDLQGATVSVYDSFGGTLLTSGTTDASGLVTLSWSGSCTVYVTVTYAPRFTAYGNTLTASGTTVITLSAASGYHCVDCFHFSIPVADTLTLTDPQFGTYTLNYNGTFLKWLSGTVSGSYPGGCCNCSIACGAHTANLAYAWPYIPGPSPPKDCRVGIQWGEDPGFPSGCPGNVGLSHDETNLGTGSVTITNPFNISMPIVACTQPCAVFCNGHVLYLSSGTITVTE
jgi:hypothetical protein